MKILFITGHRRSGTTLIGTLLDDANELCVYPGDISILYAYYPHYNNKKYSFRFKVNKLEKILNKTLMERERSTTKNINFNIFVKSFLAKVNHKNINNIEKLLKLLISSYINFYKKKFKKNVKYFVFKETSCSHLAAKMNKYFKEIKIIHILRDPRDIYSSLKSGINTYYKKNSEDKIDLITSMIVRLNLDLEYKETNEKILGKKKYKTIKYEKLVLDPKKVLKEIFSFMSVKYDDKSLLPTVLGYPSIANSYVKKISKISKTNINNWKNKLNTEELNIIEFYLKNFILKFKYDFFLKKIDEKFVISFYNQLNKKYFFKDRFI